MKQLNTRVESQHGKNLTNFYDLAVGVWQKFAYSKFNINNDKFNIKKML